MLMAVLLLVTGPGSVAPPPARAGQHAGQTVELRGRAVCLDEVGLPKACVTGSRQFGLRTAEGRIHRFLASDPLAGAFEDPRVRERDLAVEARPAGDDTVEIIAVYSVHNGKLHQVRYFCEVCNVWGYAPGPCPCCRAEMELKETPVP